MNLLISALATGLGSGYLKPAPGTWGSLLGLGIYYLYPVSLLGIIIAIFLGVYICQRGEEILREKDSPKIVWDEIVGIWIALWNIPLTYYPLAFILFRLFDIKKFYFIDKLQKYPGGLGIMLDDLAAGLVTRIIIGLLLFL